MDSSRLDVGMGVVGAVSMGMLGALAGALGAVVLDKKKVGAAASIGAVVGGFTGAVLGARSSWFPNAPQERPS